MGTRPSKLAAAIQIGPNKPAAAIQIGTSSGDKGLFQHEPLDRTKQSIRLVKVLPHLSNDGFIQCELTHNTISEASWTCLSYQWGEVNPSTSKIIQMNGYYLEVRRNLFNFLELLQSSNYQSNRRLSAMSQTCYWIDALCIDQTNNLERNHQVAQMGDIFAGAKFVHIWLGKVLVPEVFRYFLLGPANSTGINEWKKYFANYHAGLGWNVFKNGYWDRAWVTQEIMLARSIVVSLGTELFGYEDLFYHAKHMPEYRTDDSFYQFEFVRNDLRTKFLGASMVYLLYHFRRKKCSIQRDRVYSLLSFCDAHERRQIEVDYDTSNNDLVCQILDFHRDRMCVCAAAIVARALCSEAAIVGSPLYYEHKTPEWRLDDIHRRGLCLQVVVKGFQVQRRPSSRRFEIVPRPAAGFSECLEHWLLEFQLVSNISPCRSVDTIDNDRELVPFSEFFTNWGEKGCVWSSLWRGWKISVRDKKENICAIRTAMPELARSGPYANIPCAVVSSGATLPGEFIQAIEIVHDME
jgi:hypothetical protein